MKIVYCLNDVSQAGGMERSVCIKANYLADVLNYDVTIVTSDKRNSSSFFSFSSKVKILYLNINYSELDSFHAIKKIIVQVRKMRRHKRKLSHILFSLQPDICISTCTHELTLLPKIKDKSIKIAEFHFLRDFRLIDNKYNEKSYLSRILSVLGEFRKTFYLKNYAAYVVLTDKDRLLWKCKTPIYVIPNSVPFNDVGISDCTQQSVISVGRLSFEKGFNYLIDVWSLVSKKHPDWLLNIYGAGESLDELNKQIESLHLETVVKIHSPVKNIQDKYLENSIYVMSSIYEGFGLVLAEAMTCGLPCISFNCPNGPAEIINNGFDGFLVETKNINELAEKISYLIENEKERKRMGHRAKENSERFRIENIMPQWVALFKELLRKNT